MVSDEVQAILEAYLDRELAGTAEPIEELIAAHPEHAEVLERRLRMFGELGAELLPTAPSARRFDDYELFEEIGRGGMGVVYRGRRVSTGELVAVKFLREGHFADPRDRARFEREVDLLSQFSHEGIVRVEDFGEAEGRPYLVMELVQGTPLSQQLPPRGHVPLKAELREKLLLGARLANALQHAHELGVVHRDVKPQNVVLRADGRPVLLDFGLARGQGQETLTMSAEWVGTLGYLPPEQAQRGRIDARADVFGLGATLLQLLTGRVPCEAESISGLVEFFRSRMIAWPDGGVELPRPVARVLRCALAVEARDRYEGVQALGVDLRALADDRVGHPPRIGAARRVELWVRRSPARAVASLMVLAVLILGGWKGSDLWREHQREQDQAFDARLDEARELVRLGDRDGGRERLRELCRERPGDPRAWITLACAAPWDDPRGRGEKVQPSATARARLERQLEEFPPQFHSQPAYSLLEHAASQHRGGEDLAPPSGLEIEDGWTAKELALVLEVLESIYHDYETILGLYRSGIGPGLQRDPLVLLLCARAGNGKPSLAAHRAAGALTALRPDLDRGSSTLALTALDLGKGSGGVPGALDDALQIARELAMKPELSLPVLVDLSRVFQESGRPGTAQEAEEVLRRAMASRPLPVVKFNLTLALVSQPDWDRAEVLDLLMDIEGSYGYGARYWWRRANCVKATTEGDQLATLRAAVEVVDRGMSQVRPGKAHILHAVRSTWEGVIAKLAEGDAGQESLQAARGDLASALDGLPETPLLPDVALILPDAAKGALDGELAELVFSRFEAELAEGHQLPGEVLTMTQAWRESPPPWAR